MITSQETWQPSGNVDCPGCSSADYGPITTLVIGCNLVKNMVGCHKISRSHTTFLESELCVAKYAFIISL